METVSTTTMLIDTDMEKGVVLSNKESSTKAIFWNDLIIMSIQTEIERKMSGKNNKNKEGTAHTTTRRLD